MFPSAPSPAAGPGSPQPPAFWLQLLGCKKSRDVGGVRLVAACRRISGSCRRTFMGSLEGGRVPVVHGLTQGCHEQVGSRVRLDAPRVASDKKVQVPFDIHAGR